MFTAALVLGQLVMPGGVAGIAIWIIIVAAICAVVFIVCKQMGVPIPAWVVSILWVLLLAVVGVLAIKFLMSIAWG